MGMHAKALKKHVPTCLDFLAGDLQRENATENIGGGSSGSGAARFAGRRAQRTAALAGRWGACLVSWMAGCRLRLHDWRGEIETVLGLLV